MLTLEEKPSGRLRSNESLIASWAGKHLLASGMLFAVLERILKGFDFRLVRTGDQCLFQRRFSGTKTVT